MWLGKRRLAVTVTTTKGFGGKTTTKAPPSTNPVTLVSFAEKTDYQWVETDDPVMGGQSSGSFSITSNSTGHFKGVTKIVPFLKAPGFCKATTQGGTPFAPLQFPDASHWIDGAMHLAVKTSTPGYKGFKIAFGAVGAKAPTYHHGTPSFKADFEVSSGSGGVWTTVSVPFKQFSIDWSDYTGSCTTKDPNGLQHHCCSKDHPEVCPTATLLSKIDGFAVWAEGTEGDFDLEIRSIVAGPLSAVVTSTQLTPASV